MKSLKFTRPGITPGNLWAIQPDRLDFVITGDSCQLVCRVDASETQSEEEGTANARAICAVPILLSSLESAYETANQTIQDAYKCEYHQTTIAELEAERDQYRAALELAGYVFKSDPEPEKTV